MLVSEGVVKTRMAASMRRGTPVALPARQHDTTCRVVLVVEAGQVQWLVEPAISFSGSLKRTIMSVHSPHLASRYKTVTVIAARP